MRLVMMFTFLMGCPSSDGGDDSAPSAGELVGAWIRAMPILVNAVEGNVEWVAVEDGTCQVSLHTDTGVSDEFACTYTAVDGVMHFDDEQCGNGEGEYTYVIGADGVLTFSLVQDPCSVRSQSIASDWLRLD